MSACEDIMICFQKRTLNINELKEALSLMEHQETTDKYTNTSMSINGEYAKIVVDIDDDGNITVL